MSTGKRIFALVIPASLVMCAVLHAKAIAALVEASAMAAPVLPAPPPAAALGEDPAKPNADAFLSKNPFEHARPVVAGMTLASEPIDCSGVRAIVVVQADDDDASLVALDVGGTRMLRRKGMSAGDLTVAWVGADRTWLTRADGTTCEARVFAPAAAVASASASASASARPEAKKPVSVQGVVRVSPNEVHIDRGTLDRYLESPGELAKIRIAPDATGIRIAKVPPNSVLGVLGIEEGDKLLSAGGIELTSPEKIMELYARLRTFERLSMVVERKGKPMTMDYVVR